MNGRTALKALRALRVGFVDVNIYTLLELTALTALCREASGFWYVWLEWYLPIAMHR